MKSSILDPIIHFIEYNRIIQPGSTIIIGLSGGPDSVFLFFVLLALKKQYQLHIITAHVNHESRESANRDEAFCQALSERYATACYTKKLSEITLTRTYKGSFEAHARAARRSFFEELAVQHQANAVALAHHMQDQQENFFIRLVRGSSLTGLIGMKPIEGLYIRPLLATDKRDMVAYLNENHIAYCQDETNYYQTFLRNRIRHSVLPALRQADVRFDQNFHQTLDRLTQAESLLEQITDTTFKAITKQENGTYYLHKSGILEQHIALQYRLLVHWLITARVPFSPSQALLDELLRFIKKGTSATHTMYHKWKIVRYHEWFYLTH